MHVRHEPIVEGTRRTMRMTRSESTAQTVPIRLSTESNWPVLPIDAIIFAIMPARAESSGKHSGHLRSVFVMLRSSVRRRAGRSPAHGSRGDLCLVLGVDPGTSAW